MVVVRYDKVGNHEYVKIYHQNKFLQHVGRVDKVTPDTINYLLRKWRKIKNEDK